MVIIVLLLDDLQHVPHGRLGAMWRQVSVKQLQLTKRPPENFFFYSIPRDESVDVDLLLLADSMDAINGLFVYGRIPMLVS
jgi:hypothetical protein